MINSLINGDMILEPLVNYLDKGRKGRCPLHCICQNPFKWIKVKCAERKKGEGGYKNNEKN